MVAVLDVIKDIHNWIRGIDIPDIILEGFLWFSMIVGGIVAFISLGLLVLIFYGIFTGQLT